MDKEEHDRFVKKVYEDHSERIKFLDTTNHEETEIIKIQFPDFKTQYFDRMGNAITFGQWAILHQIYEYKVIKKSTVKEYKVSTVWLGLDHNSSRYFCECKPHIFETMVFKNSDLEIGSYRDLYLERYSTEEQALAGHEKVVEMAKRGEFVNEQ